MFRLDHKTAVVAQFAVCCAIASGCCQLRLPAIDPSGERIFLPCGSYTTLTAPGLLRGDPPPVVVQPGVPSTPAVPAPVSPAPLSPAPTLTPAPAPKGGCRLGLPSCALPVLPAAQKHGLPSAQKGLIPSAQKHGAPAAQKHAPPAAQKGCATPPPPPVLARQKQGCCLFPEPAFRNPPEPPPCDAPPSCQRSCGPACREADGGEPFLKLTPTRIVAPVGSEVVLLAGLCRGDGYFAMKQPIEWVLSQESVGNFVEVSDENNKARKLVHAHGRKLSANYAVARPVHRAMRLTRGTTSVRDDLTIQRGQCWISLTSPSEGVSYVSVIAPEGADWPRRRQTAKIHWVDARWSMPSPAIVRAGGKHVLTTRVLRGSALVPAVGWLVRYDILEGPAATFSGGRTSIEVPVDTQGLANAEILSQSTQPGVTRVRVQIVRPASADGASPQMLLGQGYTTITWSAPGIAVRVTGPPHVGVNATVTYQIDVVNSGDLAANDVALSAVIPPGLAYLNSQPPGQILGDKLHFAIGDLAPRASQRVTINFRAEQNGDVRFCAEARTADGATFRGCADTRIFTSALQVRLEGPESAVVGQQVQYRASVTNTGSAPLQNVTVSDRFDEGLVHSESLPSPIEKLLGNLAPGETKQFAVTFLVIKEGRWCHTLDVTAVGGHVASARRCLTATPAASPPPAVAPGAPAVPKPPLQVNHVGPKTAKVGETAEFLIDVVNNSEQPITNVRVAASYAPSLQPDVATAGVRRVGQELVWSIDNLDPGQRLTLQINCRCIQPDPAAAGRVAVTADRGLSATQEARVSISPAEPGAAPPAAVTGELKVSVAETREGLRAGETLEYLVILHNDRNVTDKNVTLTVTLPDGLELVRVSGPTAAGEPVGGRIRLVPIAEMRAGEKLRPYRFEVRALRSGRFRVSVEVTSLRSPTPVTAFEETTVLEN